MSRRRRKLPSQPVFGIAPSLRLLSPEEIAAELANKGASLPCNGKSMLGPCRAPAHYQATVGHSTYGEQVITNRFLLCLMHAWYFVEKHGLDSSVLRGRTHASGDQRPQAEESHDEKGGV